MYIFQELDKWAYDIEITFKKKYFASPRTRKQYVTICAIRDKFYDKYLKKVEKFNNIHSNVTMNHTSKDCTERLTSVPPPPPPGTRLIKEGTIPKY